MKDYIFAGFLATLCFVIVMTWLLLLWFGGQFEWHEPKCVVDYSHGTGVVCDDGKPHI